MRSPRILVATPEATRARILRLRLERLGYEVVAEARDGDAALAKARTRSLDLAIVDERLGSGDGLTTSDRLFSELDLPVVLLALRLPDRTSAREHATASLAVVSRRSSDRTLCSAIELALHHHGLRRMLDLSEKRFRTFFEASGTGAVVVEDDGTVSDCNCAFAALIGYSSPAPLLGRLLDELLYRAEHDQRRRRQAPVAPQRREEMAFRHREGRPVWVSREEARVTDPRSGRTQQLHTFHDISERRHAEVLFESLAYTDSLTGLPNRRFLEAVAPTVLERPGETGERAAVVFLDLVGFKAVNDRLGHRAGDKVLEEVGRRLDSSLRDNDCAARLGGDEFVVLLTGLESGEEARRAADRVVARLNAPYELGETTVKIGARAGVAVARDPRADLSGLLNVADQAVTSAKSVGGPVVVVAEV